MTAEFLTADILEAAGRFPDDHFDLVFGSPPYLDARTYGIGAQRDVQQWISWMLEVTEACARICKGPVVWVMAGVTRQRCYWPGCEGLIYEWWKRGGQHELYRPCIFHRVGIPGSGGQDWFRADWEYVACFKKPGALPWSDNTACGHPPKWAPGGEMSYRQADGQRTNQSVVHERDEWGSTGHATGAAGRNADGTHKTRRRKVQSKRQKPDGMAGSDGMHNQEQDWQEPVLANPGNAVEQLYAAEQVARLLQEESDYCHLNVGGGVMGDKKCHANEAPFPEALAERFVRSLCPPDGLVLDPFSGSGTTCCVAARFGRNAVGVDLRQSQTDLARARFDGLQRELFT